MYICIYVYVYMHMYMYIYINISIMGMWGFWKETHVKMGWDYPKNCVFIGHPDCRCLEPCTGWPTD